MNRLEAQTFFAELARESTQPRVQWQMLTRWLDAMPLAKRIDAVRLVEKTLKLDADVRIPCRGWIQSILAGEATPQLYLVRNLSISQVRLTDSDFQRILDHPFLGPLRRIKLFGLNLHDASLQALVACRQARSILALNLSANCLRGLGLGEMIAADAFAKLRELYLGRNAIDDAAAQALAQSPWSSRLRVLELRDNPLSSTVQQQLRASPYLQQAVVSLPDDADVSA